MKKNCEIGDKLYIKGNINTSLLNAEKQQKISEGSIYRVDGLIGNSWDLSIISGIGPFDLRIANSDIPKYTFKN